LNERNLFHKAPIMLRPLYRQAFLLSLVVFGTSSAAALADAGDARKILNTAGVRGGLVVHLGCGEGRLTAALKVNDSLMVHGLDANPDNVAKARQHVASLGMYGTVSVARLESTRLPYVDNLVNLIVVEDAGAVSNEEIVRVLCPGGVALFARDGLKKIVKPRPDSLDDWTHYLYDATGNAVSKDETVGPPNRLQWVGSPRYSRHHDRLSSFNAMVSAGGRVFYIIDEAMPVSILLPPKWKLVARDAFNGAELWRRSIGTWHPHLWRLKSGPANIPRRLVADDTTVYATLGSNAPVTAMDAATGETVRTYDGTDGTEEILLTGGDLILQVKQLADAKPVDRQRINQSYSAAWDNKPRVIMVVDAATGETRWSRQHVVLPNTLAADGENLVFHNGESVVCLSQKSGEETWRSKPVPRSEKIQAFYSPIMVIYIDVVLFSGGETAGKQTGSWYEKGEDTMTALDLKSGKVLWTAYHPPSGYRSAEDLLVAGGLVWTGETTSGRAKGVFTGRDPKTGAVKSEFAPDVETYWFHHRCYRGKATEKYLLMSRTGIEFIDHENEHWIPHHWVRGACLYGIMPANGLVYAPQHPCACYLESKQSGFNALAAATEGPRVPAELAGQARLEKGPAFDRASSFLPQVSSLAARASNWPTLRGNNGRSGTTAAAVSADVKQQWEAEIGGRLSSVTVADGRLFVAAIDRHTVYSLDAKTGEKLWNFVAGGRVDSPPTIHKGRAIFGSADGFVYCLDASDGELVWRFRAATTDERTMAFEQLESVWPVHGSVMVEGDAVWFVSGRSMFLDGGLTLWRLDADTGEVLTETVLDDKARADDDNLQEYVAWLNMPTALPDVLSSDGKLVYMRGQPFHLDGTRLPLQSMPTSGNADAGAPPATQDPARAHLFSPTGFLDDTWWHRTYWMYGSRFVSGWQGYYRAGKAAPSGKILVFDDENVYGFGRKPRYFRWTTQIEHQLFAADKTPDPTPLPPGAAKRNAGSAVRYQWSVDLPLFARGMVLADETIFVAGPPDLLDEEAALKTIDSIDTKKQLAEQEASLTGQKGALLWAVSATDGNRLSELKLKSPPVFDGLIAANGSLYLATTNGKVVCLGAE
jgi:outer membrane protein assembly factor BamB